MCGWREIAREFGCDHRTVGKALKRLENVYQLIEQSPSRKGTVVTINEVDSVIGFAPQNESKIPHRTYHRMNSNKTIYSDKTEKTNKGYSIKAGNLRDEEHTLIEEILDWICMPVFKPKLSRELYRGRLTKVLTTQGLKNVKKAYKSAAIYGGYPHPKIFWQNINSE